MRSEFQVIHRLGQPLLALMQGLAQKRSPYLELKHQVTGLAN